MSLIKLAKHHMTYQDIDDDYEDNRSYWRRAKGKTLGYSIGAPFAPLGLVVGGVLGHNADRRRKEKDFRRHPKMFKKIR